MAKLTRSERLRRDGAVDPVLFYSQREEWGNFSMFSSHQIILPSPWTFKPVTYRTGEHRFQALKAVRVQDHDEVVSTATASEAKTLGRHIGLRADWGADINTVCWFAMLEAALAKTLQHPDVHADLQSTGSRWIYEDSPTDDIWGWRHGQSYHGHNLLGLVWLQVRAMTTSVRSLATDPRLMFGRG